MLTAIQMELFHLVGEQRPQEFRHRITTSLRGVNIERLFGSQRALKTVEDFTEFEQRGAYFDGDMVNRHKRRASIHSSGEARFISWRSFRKYLTFRRSKARHLRQARFSKGFGAGDSRPGLFFGKAQCCGLSSGAVLYGQPHAQSPRRAVLQTHMVNNLMETADVRSRHFPFGASKDSPPYLHDGRLLTLEDTVGSSI